jgi:hypothetical protein
VNQKSKEKFLPVSDICGILSEARKYGILIKYIRSHFNKILFKEAL